MTIQKSIIQTQFVKNGIQGASLMGKIYAIIGSLIGITVGLILIIYGSFMIQDQHTLEIKGHVIEAECQQDVTFQRYICNIAIEYEISNKKYLKYISNYISGSQIHKRDIIILFVKPDDPNDVIYFKSPIWWPIVMVCFGSLVILFSLLYIYFIFRYKALAMISGLSKVAE